MTDNRLRLNNSKRVALKKEHWRVVNQTPSELKGFIQRNKTLIR